MIGCLPALRAAFALFAITLFVTPAASKAQQPQGDSARVDDATVMLIAKPRLQHPVFASTILIARPMEAGGHAGFILNRPTDVKLGDAFPDDEPSQKVQDPVFLGGPVNPNVIFALVRRDESPGEGSIRFTKDMFVALSGDTVDRIIQKESAHARFFAGAVVWRPGELQEQLAQGLWYVMEPDVNVALARDTETLWERLVAQSERSF